MHGMAWVCWGRGGGGGLTCHVAKGRGRDANVDAVEPGLAVLAKDEVGVADDQGLGEEGETRLCHDGVLVSGELAAVEALVSGV